MPQAGRGGATPASGFHRVDFPQIADDLLGAVSLAFRRESPSGPIGPSGLSLKPDQFFRGQVAGIPYLPMVNPPSHARTVVSFAGHMIDAPNRAVPRFPRESEPLVAQAIRSQLEMHHASAGFCALACGADLIFAEAILDRGGELHLILPINIGEFLEASVRVSGDPRWERRFHEVRARATTEQVHGDDYLRGSGTAFLLAGMLIDGYSQMRAFQHGLRVITLGVWDGQPGDGLGGTASFVGHAVRQRRDVYCINPAGGSVFRPGIAAEAAASKHTWRTISSGTVDIEYRLAAHLFADVAGFSGLREREVPTYLRVAMNAVADALGEAEQYLVVNTWGDGLFVVTQSPESAAALANRLHDSAEVIDHRREGLARPLRFRIGLHAGPTFFTSDDPIVHRPNAFGRDVSLAARIEPLVALGETWASGAFVALSASLSSGEVPFDPIGPVSLPKGAGEMMLHRLRRQP